ncbi:CobW family GTP-binding protein [uncultured Acetatifactor sp.]|uniref:CobW family GTP-binding protein n=1 Tax=uncultured Acetatifactor sp. TaxID=1671927 RepID=UPI00260748B5|nr:CobW family GTP-binding protein [uncultured Acetatifactor sp.]
MTKIDVVSGFLGAGKTTLIKKLLQEALDGSKTVLIENEFGEIGIDGGFLKEAGIEIKEMNSGCICCSLVGDFGASLKEVIETYAPERILIEPSGVGKLSDVLRAVEDVAADLDVQVNSAVAVVDASKAKMYIKNFGEFFINQIEYAGTIILSRTDKADAAKVQECVRLIREHNDKATIITTPLAQLEGRAVLETIEGADTLADMMKEMLEHAKEEHEHHHHEEGECCGHKHHHDHDGEECCGHGHHHHHDDEECCGHEHHHHEEGECCEHKHHHDHDGEECCGHGHHHHEEGESCGHGHDHDGGESCEHGHHHEHDGEECCGHEHHHEEGESCGHGHHHHEEGENCGHEHHHHDGEECCEHGHHHDGECHEHHHDHDGHCGCGHNHHDHHGHHHADEVFTSWGKESPAKFTAARIESILTALDSGEYGAILRAKGMVPAEDGTWIYFDYVPGEHGVRTGKPDVTGKFCVIGAQLREDRLEELFRA